MASPAKFRQLSLNTAAAKNPLSVSREQVRELIDAKKATIRTDPEYVEKIFTDMLIYFKAASWNQAFNAGVEAVAATEKLDEAEEGVHACTLHNLASALHHLEHRDAARAFYEESMTELAQSQTPVMLKCFCMDHRDRMLVYMQSRLALLATGGKPKANTYWSSDGGELEWPVEEIEEAKVRAKELAATSQNATITIESLGKSYPVGSTPRNALW